MKTAMLNPKSKSIEFWVDSETKEVMCAFRGRITLFKDADTDVGTQLMTHLVHTGSFEPMYEEGFTDPIMMMQEYIRRNFATFDGKADIDEQGFNIEFTGHPKSNHPINLTNRELEYIKLACQDLADKQIAAMMAISTNTVNIYRKRAEQKTATASKPGLVAWAYKEGVV